METAEEFWARLAKLPSGCWEWRGIDGRPYRNRLYGAVTWRGQVYRTHRLAWELTHGPLGEHDLIIHSCDNPPCCNPDHLRVGTYSDNMRDRAERRGGKPSDRLRREPLSAIDTGAKRGRGRPPREEQCAHLNVSIPLSLIDSVRQYAAERSIGLRHVVEAALKDLLSRDNTSTKI